MKHTIDAQGKKLGRVAAQAAVFLMGKDAPDYRPNKDPESPVEIVNASKADIRDRKRKTEQYSRYSGYPGGLRKLTMAQLAAKKGYSEIFRIAVSGMLPKNKLRPRRLKRLSISE